MHFSPSLPSKWEGFCSVLAHLPVQLALALLQLRNSSAALCEHGLLLLERKLQLQVLLTGALTNQSGAVKLLLQRGHLKSREGVENMCLRSGFWMNLHEFSCIVTNTVPSPCSSPARSRSSSSSLLSAAGMSSSLFCMLTETTAAHTPGVETNW